MKYISKNQKGITLIALVITIIVLIILAGISINLLFGDNGIIKKAQDAGSKYQTAANDEETYLSNLDRQIDDILNGNGFSGNNNNNNNNNNNAAPVTGALGQPVNIDKYGEEVLNYTAANLKWRLFFEDANNIYLISETQDGNYPLNNVTLCNYENDVYTPKDASYVSGESVSRQGQDLMPLLGGATSSSVGINSNGVNIFTSSNTSPSEWSMAYLCDTDLDGPWKDYKTGDAAWAMGGPTMELFTASYNATHTNHQISLYIGGGNGYTDSFVDDDWFKTTENKGIYRLSNSGCWWIASRGNGGNQSIININDYWGSYTHNDPGTSTIISARPVVCIQKLTGFTCQFASQAVAVNGISAPLNTEKYGWKVQGYNAAGLVWRLFYEDANNVYLISETQDHDLPIKDGVVPFNSEGGNRATITAKDSSYVSGESVSSEGKALMPLLGGATSSSVGTIDIGTNSNGINLLTSSNTNSNIWGTAYLCDTRENGPWAAYKTGSAAWAMGAPTIELFAASYNATHQGGNQISLGIGDYGYTENTSREWFVYSERHGIYSLGDEWGKFWWIASPADRDTNSLLYVDFWGCLDSYDGLGSTYGDYGLPLRPIVCFQKANFNYTLVDE